MANYGPTLRVLIVEDHDDSREMLEQLLLAHGHSVVSAGSCQEARVAAGARRFDMLICDIDLPDGDGVELMRSLRREHLMTTIALSAMTQPQHVARCEKAGVHAFLAKPIGIDELVKTITQLMIPPDVIARRRPLCTPPDVGSMPTLPA
jgi:DNA-binding response OmpR family regulator